MVNFNSDPFKNLVEIVAALRDPNTGCPWDKEQTHSSLKPYLIEESYEVLDAIDNDQSKLAGELGDVLLQVVLHSQVAKDDGRFDIEQVVNQISKKLVHRHPHVFADTKVSGTEEVLRNWEQLKGKEDPQRKGALAGIPKSMPALLRAQRTGEKAARVGFEWNTDQDVRDKVLEEMREFLEVCLDSNSSRAALVDEFGDILFALTQLARRLKLNSEEALQASTNKFTRRFVELEKRSAGDLTKFKLEELDKIWEEIKSEEKKV